MTTWDQARAAAIQVLADAGIESPEAESRFMVEHLAGESLATCGPEHAPERPRWRLAQMLERRSQGEPLQYVLGAWAFRRLDLFIDRRVLIPRPETEEVAGAALVELDRAGGPLVDLGTGSGAIALAVASERPGTEVWGSDRSPDALAVARANLSALGRVARHVRLVEGSWFDALPRELSASIGVLVSNPPYVADGEVLPPVVADWEPVSALRSGPDGLDDIRVIVAGAPAWLRAGGALVVEHGAAQGPAVRALATDAGFTDVRTGQDLAGRDRWLVARA